MYPFVFLFPILALSLFFFPSLRQSALKNAGGAASKSVGVHILTVRRVKRQSICGYRRRVDLDDYLHITVALPSLLYAAHRILTHGINIPTLGFMRFQCYESRLAFPLRFMIDCNLRGGGWVELRNGTYDMNANTYDANAHRDTHCQLEVDAQYDDIIGHDAEGEWLRMAPMRVLSFDIECAGRKGRATTTKARRERDDERKMNE